MWRVLDRWRAEGDARLFFIVLWWVILNRWRAEGYARLCMVVLWCAVSGTGCAGAADVPLHPALMADRLLFGGTF